MTEEANSRSVAEAVRRINQAWVHGRFEELQTLIDPEIVLATPGFGERIHGSEVYVSGHRDFAQNATIHRFAEHEIEVDLLGGQTAVATYRYTLDYERAGKRYDSTGRDLYIFRLADGHWRAVWRTILDVDERALGVD